MEKSTKCKQTACPHNPGLNVGCKFGNKEGSAECLSLQPMPTEPAEPAAQAIVAHSGAEARTAEHRLQDAEDIRVFLDEYRVNAAKYTIETRGHGETSWKVCLRFTDKTLMAFKWDELVAESEAYKAICDTEDMTVGNLSYRASQGEKCIKVCKVGSGKAWKLHKRYDSYVQMLEDWKGLTAEASAVDVEPSAPAASEGNAAKPTKGSYIVKCKNGGCDEWGGSNVGCKNKKEAFCLDFQKTDTAKPTAATVAAASSRMLEFVRSAVLDIDRLEPHEDAVAFWGEYGGPSADMRALEQSVREHGVLEPLMVVPMLKGKTLEAFGDLPEGEQEYFIVDGCSRYLAACSAGLDSVPCSVYAMDIGGVRSLAFEKNAVRHHLGTGQRILRYLDLNQGQVLDAWDRGQDPAKKGAMGGRGKKAGVTDSGFSKDAIAVRLGVSDKDVLAGIHLLKSKAAGGLAQKDEHGRTVFVPSADPGFRDAIDGCYADVMEGRTPIRRWLAAFGGRRATEGAAKAPTNYPRLAVESLVGLRNALDHWDGWGLGQEKDALFKMNEFMPAWYNMLEAMPMEIARHALAVLNATYPGLKPASPASRPKRKLGD